MVSLVFHTDNESSDQCRISLLLDTLTRVMYMHFFCSRCYSYMKVVLQCPYETLKKAFCCLRYQKYLPRRNLRRNQPKALFQNEMLRLLREVLHGRVNQIYCFVTFKQIERHGYNTRFAVHPFTGRSLFSPHLMQFTTPCCIKNHLITFQFNNLTFTTVIYVESLTHTPPERDQIAM